MNNLNFKQAFVPPAINQTPTIDLSSYDTYYQQEFKKIIESNESYKGKWNWYAFLFSWLWLFNKGAWQIALIILGTIILTYVGLPSYLLLVWPIQCGRRGTWLYYRVKVKNEQQPKSFLFSWN